MRNRVTLLRLHTTDVDTFGALFVDQKFLCFTIEDEYRDVKVPGETCIPEGVYPFILEYSPKFTPRYGHLMLTIANVPNFTGIRVHKGRTEKDTAGCPLVGNGMMYVPGGASWLPNSGLAYDRIYPILAAVTPCYITVTNAWGKI